MLLFLDPGSEIRDPGSGMGINQDPGSGINIPDPPHCQRYCPVLLLKTLSNEKGGIWKEVAVHPATAFTSLSLLPAMEGRVRPGVEGELCGNVTLTHCSPTPTKPSSAVKFHPSIPLTPFILPLRLCPLLFFLLLLFEVKFYYFQRKKS